ncbi:ABC transporter permease [Streptomyces sp. NBC_00133]|uniref:ABC transporter permease n=1 Tax=Streptomyces sp. NBC_00133 TaxID=2903624 RepID=UPI00324FCA6E
MKRTAVLAVSRTTLLRTAHDRTALFFMLLLPVGIIVVIGAVVGGFDQFRIAVVRPGDGAEAPIARSLATELDRSDGLKARTYGDESAARTALRRSETDAVVLLPPGLDTAVRAGRPVSVPVLVQESAAGGHAAVSSISAAVARHAAQVQAAHFAVAEAGGTFDQRLAQARTTEAHVAPIEVRSVSASGPSDILPLGYGYSTPTMLVLFVFINSLAGGAVIVQTRRSGVYERALAAPVTAGTLMLGETAAYLALALVQSALIVGIGALVFGVSWGNPLAAGLLIAVWALIGTGAGVLSGAVFRTPEQASAIGPAVGIGLGMLGGWMWPLALVPGWLRTAGHAVPHAWAVDSWTVLLSQNGGVTDILRNLIILSAFAAALLTLASFGLRRQLTGAAPGTRS